MNKIAIFLYLFLAICFTACYEDKGDYEYHPINEISISNIEKEYSREKWQLLEISPDITFSMQETDELAYRWEVNGRVVSTERNLKYDVDVDVADELYKCRFAVMNVADSARYYQEFGLRVVTPYERGLMVLSEQEGKAMLSFRSEAAEDDEFSKWIYFNENEGYLEGKPLSLQQVWAHDDHILVATSAGNYKLDRQILKHLKRYDGTTMLEKDSNFEMKFCTFEDMSNYEDYGCAIGTNGRVYTFRAYNDYFSLPSPLPVPDYNDMTSMIDYELSDKCLIVTRGFGGSMRYFLGYDDKNGRFLYFYHSSSIGIDDEQLNTVLVREPVIGIPILAIGIWDYEKYASFFYDPLTDVAKVVSSHNHTFGSITEDDVITLEDHDFTPTTILKFCDATARAVFSSGNVIRQLYIQNVTAPSTVLCDELPAGSEITCLKFSGDRKKLYVGIMTDNDREYKGDLYVLDAATGDIMGKPYQGAGGRIVDVIEKY